MKTILIIEDDRELNRGLCAAMQKAGYETSAAFDLKTAGTYLESDLSDPALVLLDVNLPDGSGIDFLTEIKRKYPEIPVILLTSNDTDMDVVNGLEKGADDYITKPFSLAVLRARVAVQIRNAVKAEDAAGGTGAFGKGSSGNCSDGNGAAGGCIAAGAKCSGYNGRNGIYQSESYFFDFDKMIFRNLTGQSKRLINIDNQINTGSEEQMRELLNKQVCGTQSGDSYRIETVMTAETVDLSKTEQRLLHILVANAGVTMKRSQLIDRIWTDGEEYVDENALSVAVKRLRDKLDAKENIRTVYGLGYRWEDNGK